MADTLLHNFLTTFKCCFSLYSCVLLYFSCMYGSAKYAGIFTM